MNNNLLPTHSHCPVFCCPVHLHHIAAGRRSGENHLLGRLILTLRRIFGLAL
jgi:hypothetical protein